MIVSKSGVNLWITIGALTSVSLLLGPVHEVGHWFMGADITSWTTTVWRDEPISGPGVLSGYLTEFIFIFCLDLFGTRMGRSFFDKTQRAGNRLRAWSIGYMGILFFEALVSDDFTIHVLSAGATYWDMFFAWIVSAGLGTVVRVKRFVQAYSISFPNE